MELLVGHVRHFEPNTAQKCLAVTVGAISIGAGLFCAVAFPGWAGHALLGVLSLIAIGQVLGTFRRGLQLSDTHLVIYGSFQRREYRLGDIGAWKLHNGQGGLNSWLQLTLKSGANVQVQDLSLLGVRDHEEFSRIFAQYLRSSRAGAREQG